MNKFVKSSLNVSAILAVILAVLSFIVPFLLGGFIVVGLGFLLGIFALFGEKKILGIVSIILCIVSLIISPTFWLYLSGLSLSSKSDISGQDQIQTQTNSSPAIEKKEPTMEELQAQMDELFKPETTVTKKIFTYAIIKQADGSYNYYSAVYQMGLKENMEKAFSQKGLNISQVKVNIKGIDHRVVLETNALEISKNPEKLKAFLDLYKGKELRKEVDNNLITNVIYPITSTILEEHKDAIAEMNEYSGFLPKLVIQNL